MNFLQKTAKWLPFFFLFVSTQPYAQENILTVLSGNQETYNNFYSILENKSQKNITYTKVNATEINNDILNKHNIIVAIGYKAAMMISKHKPKATVIYSLIPKNKNLKSKINCNNKQCYKIYINQPLHRYISLFNILFPKERNLAFVTTKEKNNDSLYLSAHSRENGFTYKEIQIGKSSNIARTLIKKLNKNDVLLALPNPNIYNANNAKSIILSSYHKNVPIIAYSKSFAKAGALISLYSSINDIADETVNLINKIITSGQQIEKEHYPDNFSIEINSAVARSLNIDLDSENIIKRKIK